MHVYIPRSSFARKYSKHLNFYDGICVYLNQLVKETKYLS